jgi:hypothetical protein
MTEWLAPKFNDLKGLGDQQLRDRYDAAVGPAAQTWHATFYLDELRRRESKQRERQMLRLTVAIALFTVVNVTAVCVALFK